MHVLEGGSTEERVCSRMGEHRAGGRIKVRGRRWLAACFALVRQPACSA